MKITEYTILESGTANHLEREVNRHLKAGWILHGGLQMVSDAELTVLYAQAMVLEEEGDNADVS